MKNFFKSKAGIITAGSLIGVIAALLVYLGNPKNMGFCIACFERDISGAEQHQQSAIDRLGKLSDDLGTTASEVGGISDSVGSSANKIGGVAERIGTDQARVAASARLIAEGQGILRDIQESNQQENKPTKD